MFGSVDSLEFCIELPVTENSAVPLHCWQNISLSDIWISSHLLPNRNKACNIRGAQGIYHTLEKKDNSKYIGSFSVYLDSDIKSEQEEIFFSDSDEDIFGSDSVSSEKIEKLSNDMLNATVDVVLPFIKSYNNNNNNKTNYLETENINSKSVRKDETNLYSSKNLSFQSLKISANVKETRGYTEQNNAKILLSEENLEKSKRGMMDEANNVFVHNSTKNITVSHSNLAFVSEFYDGESKDDKDMQMLKTENKDSGSHISLKEIVDFTPEINLKDFAFALKKNDNSDILSITKKVKINKNKDKNRKKKPQKCIPLDRLFEDSNTTQDFYCDKYIQKLLQEKDGNDQISKNALSCDEEFPDLVSESEEVMFIHSDKTIKGENVEFNAKSLFDHSEKAIKEEIVESSVCLNNLNKLEVTKIENVEEIQTMKNGKIIIENIPHDVCEDDILLILCGYGEIRNFSMISSGESLKAFVEIDLICDIDWVIECLNESELFGASSGVIKCYEQL